LDDDVHCTVLVLDTMTDAVRAISVAHAALQPADASESSQLPPVLPYVHAMWPFYVSAVASGHAVAAKRALDRLSLVASACGGDFLRQRFASELWPHLSPLLRGVPLAHADAAPAAVARVQHAAIACVCDLASSGATRDTVADAVMEVAEALATVLRTARAREVEASAERALAALGALDADAVWLVQLKTGRATLPCRPPGAAALLEPLANECRARMARAS
jgi:hypothetical protein